MQAEIKKNELIHSEKPPLRQLFQMNFKNSSMIIALVFIMLLFQFLTDGILLKPLNITNLILQNSYILILAVGMVLVIIAGHIDLSVGSIAAFVGAISAILMVNYDMPTYVAIIISLLIGAVIGAWQGFWVAYVKIPAFIVTLAGMLIFRGLTTVILDGKSIAPFPEDFKEISAGFIPDISSNSPVHMLTMIIGVVLSLIFIFFRAKNRKTQLTYQFDAEPMNIFLLKIVGIVAVINVLAYTLAAYEGIPNVLIILAALIAAYTFITNKTTAGRYIYAVGGNEKAAQLSGIKTKKVTFWVFVNMGVLAALSGLIFAARLNAATPKAGNLFELDAIAASFIGGASAYGGIGTVPGAIIGGLVMGVMNNGMSLMGIGVDWQQAIKGIVLLAAVAFDVYNKNKA